MLSVVKNRLRVALLDDLALFHYHDLVGNIRDDCQIMADQQHADVAFMLQVGDELKYLRLYRHIQSGGRLICDQ